MEASLRHYYQSVVTSAPTSPMEEFAFEFDGGMYGGDGEPGKDSSCPESILNFILDADKAFKTQEDKLDARCRLGVPQDPHGWTAKEVNAWVAWLASTFELSPAGDLVAKLRDFPLDGSSLAQLSLEDFYCLFGSNGDVIYNNFRRWLDVSPGGQHIQDELYQVQQDIFRSEDFKHTLLNALANTQNFWQQDSDSNMSSPSLSPPMSDDLASNDADLSQSRWAPSTSFPWYPRATPMEYPMGEADVNASPLLIDEPEPLIGVTQKRRRGRPRKPKPPKQKRSQPILYKFILGHLNNPSMHNVVEWVNKQSGVFRFHSASKDEFAELWGRYKGNRELMTYQNMARALRNYTRGKTRIMERVKRKLHYKFCAEFIR